MERKNILFVFCMIVLIVCIVFFINRKDNDGNGKITEQSNINVTIELDEETGLYKVYDNGQLIKEDIDESMIKIYEDNPYFDPSF